MASFLLQHEGVKSIAAFVRMFFGAHPELNKEEWMSPHEAFSQRNFFLAHSSIFSVKEQPRGSDNRVTATLKLAAEGRRLALAATAAAGAADGQVVTMQQLESASLEPPPPPPSPPPSTQRRDVRWVDDGGRFAKQNRTAWIDFIEADQHSAATWHDPARHAPETRRRFWLTLHSSTQ